tara:strand:- start:1082 stop:1363 length:282 start_codon:yes stop_codon:yes gene_type:complete
MKNTTQPQPNLARNKVGSHNPNTIQVCTVKRAIMIRPATIREILEFIDIPSRALIYSSVFLNPHLSKKYFEGQNPVQRPICNIKQTNITTSQD